MALPLSRRSVLLAGLLVGGPLRAADTLVVVVHVSAPVPTRAQIEAMFLGMGGPLLPVDLPIRAAVHARFYERLTGRDLNWVRAQWARAVFTGRGAPPRVMADTEAVKRAIAADAGLMGYLPKDELDTRCKPVLELG